jgi:hypothetical protein
VRRQTKAILMLGLYLFAISCTSGLDQEEVSNQIETAIASSSQMEVATSVAATVTATSKIDPIDPIDPLDDQFGVEKSNARSPVPVRVLTDPACLTVSGASIDAAKFAIFDLINDCGFALENLLVVGSLVNSSLRLEVDQIRGESGRINANERQVFGFAGYGPWVMDAPRGSWDLLSIRARGTPTDSANTSGSAHPIPGLDGEVTSRYQPGKGLKYRVTNNSGDHLEARGVYITGYDSEGNTMIHAWQWPLEPMRSGTGFDGEIRFPLKVNPPSSEAEILDRPDHFEVVVTGVCDRRAKCP